MNWQITLVVAFFMPYLARIPGMFTRGPEWLWSYIPSLNAVLFFSMFNLIALVPLGVLGFFSASKGMEVSLILTTIVYMGLTFFFHYSYDLASDAQAAIGLMIIPLVIAGITLVTALVTFFAEIVIKR